MVLLIFATLFPSAAGAVDVNLGIAAEAVYDSNVGRSAARERDDVSFRFRPTIGIRSQDRKFGVNFSYSPTYEAFVTYTDLNDLTHRLVNSFTYAASEKTDLALSNRLSILEVLNSGDLDDIDEEAQVPDQDVARDRVLLYGTSLNIEHAFSPRWAGSTDIGFDLFNSDRENSVDSRTVSASQSFSYAINASNRIGGGGSAVVQMFDEVEFLPASTTYIYRVFGTYVRNFGERTTLSINLGPALISTDQDSGTAPSGLVEDSDDLRFTLFGAVTLTHSWTPTLVSSMTYDRRENTSSGNGASAIADSVSFRTSWRPSELWDVSLMSSWVQRKSPSDELRSVDTQRWGAAMRVARRLTRHLTASAWVNFSKQDSVDTDRSPNNFGDFTAIVGIKYDFDPFRF
jgi:hypothetical protein